MTPDLRRLTQNDLPRLRQFWIEQWGGEEMIARGNISPSSLKVLL